MSAGDIGDTHGEHGHSCGICGGDVPCAEVEACALATAEVPGVTLLPCPFCGGPASAFWHGYVDCPACGACGAFGPDRTPDSSAEALWIRRAPARTAQERRCGRCGCYESDHGGQSGPAFEATNRDNASRCGSCDIVGRYCERFTASYGPPPPALTGVLREPTSGEWVETLTPMLLEARAALDAARAELTALRAAHEATETDLTNTQSLVRDLERLRAEVRAAHEAAVTELAIARQGWDATKQDRDELEAECSRVRAAHEVTVRELRDIARGRTMSLDHGQECAWCGVLRGEGDPRSEEHDETCPTARARRALGDAVKGRG